MYAILSSLVRILFLTAFSLFCLRNFQALSAIPFLYTPLCGISLVFMLLYVWSREFPNANINIYGLVSLKVFGNLTFPASLSLFFILAQLCKLRIAIDIWLDFQAFYLPWAMLALDVIFGSRLLPDFLGIVAGHLYYFLTVLHPLAGGKNILKTPAWVYPFS